MKMGNLVFKTIHDTGCVDFVTIDKHGKVNLYDFYNLCRHEFNEVKQRPHLSSQIGTYSGSLNVGYAYLP